MNLIYFIRLIFKNTLLIGGVAVAMALLVYVATRSQPKTYTSSTTIYTGIATGYDIESGSNARFDLFSNNAQFDNLINIIKSRETQEKTAIRLMAQHLILPKPDERYCLRETWQALMEEVPGEIKRMVDIGYLEPDPEPETRDSVIPQGVEDLTVEEAGMPASKVMDTIYESRTVTERIRKFRVKATGYTIKAGDSPNSICEKFGLTPEQLRRMNSPMPPFQGGRRLIVGSASEPYWVDSTFTRQVPVVVETEKSASAEIIKVTPVSDSSGPDPVAVAGENSDIVSEENISRYNRLVRDLTDYKNASQDNYIFNTLQSTNPFYSVQKISGIKVARIQSSDLLKLSYDSNDPAVCMQTLKILTEVFKDQYQSITTTQTSLVSDYFRERVNAAKETLDSLEQDLLQFRMKNRIINYDEQTKFISEQKETLDRDWYEEAGKYSAAQTALALVEENLGEKGRSILQNSTVLEKRRRVYELALQISMEEIRQQASDTVQIADIRAVGLLKDELARLKIELKDELLKSYDFNRSVEGLNIQIVLQKWLEKAIEVEESHARYNKLTERKNEFLKKYDEFAPLGSQLKKIDREIDLAQQDYMNHLNNLNQSIMKQRNVEQSDIQIIDNPVYPIKPNASKRMILLVAAFMAGLVLTASIIILLEFLDTSIKFPSRLAELSGLKLLGAFPRIPDSPDNQVNYPMISARAIDQITQRIRLQDLQQNTGGELPFVLFFISIRENEGKTYLATRVVEKLRAGGSRVLFIKPLEQESPDEFSKRFNSFDQPEQAWDYEYSIPENFSSVRNINELLKNYAFVTKGYQYVVIELPALLLHEYPAGMTQAGNMSILVASATRNWNKADNEALELYVSSTERPVVAMLNGCHVDQMETIIGEIPKRRSLIRKLVKRIVHLDFKLANT